jgi:hypothetical protein
MGKSKAPKSQKVLDPSKDNLDPETQSAPRKYRQVLAYSRIKSQKVEKTKTKKKEKPVQSSEEKFEHMRELVNRTAKKETRRYQKLQEHFQKKKERKKSGLEEELDRGLMAEKRLVDRVKFGEQASAPPKITAIPKKQKVPKSIQILQQEEEKKKKKLTTKDSQKLNLDDLSNPKRKTKLKELAEGDRVALLREREKLIALYRSKKALKPRHAD